MAKRISATRQQYNIERERAARRIQRQVKVPIFVAREMLPKVPQRVTQKSISELKAIRAKHGKNTRNFIQETYQQYIQGLKPEQLKQHLKTKKEFETESARRSEIVRKKRALPDSGTTPIEGREYEEGTGDEIYTTLNEINRIIENTLSISRENVSTKKGRKILSKNKESALDLKNYLFDKISQLGREKVAKMLNDQHDEIMKAVDAVIFGYKDGEKEGGWTTINIIFMDIDPHDIEYSTAQMDDLSDEETY